MAAIPHSPGGCDEFCRYFYVEKRVTAAELQAMRGRLQGLREHGEHIVLRVVPLEEVWSISGDAKAIMYVASVFVVVAVVTSRCSLDIWLMDRSRVLFPSSHFDF